MRLSTFGARATSAMLVLLLLGARARADFPYAWGDNNFAGQQGTGGAAPGNVPIVIPNLVGVQQVSSESTWLTAYALLWDGTVKSWGYGFNGEIGNGFNNPSPTPVSVINLAGPVASVSAGGRFALVRYGNGTIAAWGLNNLGQIGNGNTTSQFSPVPTLGLSGPVAAISAGQFHSLALLGNGTVAAWGWNGFGQVGNGNTANQTSAVPVTGLSGPVTQVAGGPDHSLALLANGAVMSWGNNAHGQLGTGDTTQHNNPVSVTGLSGPVRSLAAGGGQSLGLSFSMAVLGNGTVAVWGNNADGELGIGNTNQQNSPVVMTSPNINNIIAVAGGTYSGYALRADGTVWAWGNDASGQLGDGLTATQLNPIQITSLSGIVSITSGQVTAFAVKGNDVLGTWGDNQLGQLGNGNHTNATTPGFTSSASNGFKFVAAGDSHGLAIKADGTIWSWGDNSYGQLGNGTTNSSTAPAQISGLTMMTAAAAGNLFSLAVKADGTAWGWGTNTVGQLGAGSFFDHTTTPVQVSGLTNVVAVAAGYAHGMALKADGTVWSWGFNQFGQLGNGTSGVNSASPVQSSITNVKAISTEANAKFSLALKADGTVWAWGNNQNSQLGNNVGIASTTPVQVGSLTNMIAIAAGSLHGIALKADGTVWAWGTNFNGQLGNGTTTSSITPVQVSVLSNVIKIAAGDVANLALEADGTLWAWGNNGHGQIGNGTTTDVLTPVQIFAPNGYTFDEIAAGGNWSFVTYAPVPEPSLIFVIAALAACVVARWRRRFAWRFSSIKL